MTPNELEILIHCYVSPQPHPRNEAPAVQEALDWLVTSELIAPLTGAKVGCYTITERGRHHMQQLLDLRFPIRQWINQHGEVIITKLK